MADKDNIGSLTDDEVQEEAVVKTGNKISFLPVLLKWIAVIFAAMIFIVTVVVITVSIMNRQGKGMTGYPTSPEYRDSRELLQWYQAVGQVKALTADAIPATIVVEAALGYPENDKATPQELTARLVELKDFMRSYFRNKTVAELQNEENIKIEVRNQINDNILSNSKIRDVKFLQYDIIVQE